MGVYSLLIIFSLVPSIIWLLIFLKKDSHPESNRMILKIFLLGMLAVIPTALLELGFFDITALVPFPRIIMQIIGVFLGIALIEEAFKYLVVKRWVLRNRAFDEPVDAMLYMIIAALGFAAAENLLIFVPMYSNFQLLETTVVSIFRFVGATFLHALCSGLIGYYMALSFLRAKNRFKLAFRGILLAVLLHGFYDLSIMEVEGRFKFIIPVLILSSLAVFVSFGFKKVKQLKSICLPRQQTGKIK